MKTIEIIKLEISDMKDDLMEMEKDDTLADQQRSYAIFTQKQVIKALEWVLE
jgi:hypothetical protein